MSMRVNADRIVGVMALALVGCKRSDANAKEAGGKASARGGPAVSGQGVLSPAVRELFTALRKAGVRPGDTVRIGSVELEWEPLEEDR